MWLKEYRGYKTKCWIWRGALHRGYGHCNPGNHLGEQYTHRWIYKKYRGEIPKGYEPDHLCNVKACGNPKHLELITKLENIRRRDIRQSYLRSNAGPLACRLFSDKEISFIRKTRKNTNLSYAKLAKQFGVSPMCIHKICTRQTYKKRSV